VYNSVHIVYTPERRTPLYRKTEFIHSIPVEFQYVIKFSKTNSQTKEFILENFVQYRILTTCIREFSDYVFRNLRFYFHGSRVVRHDDMKKRDRWTAPPKHIEVYLVKEKTIFAILSNGNVFYSTFNILVFTFFVRDFVVSRPVRIYELYVYA